MSKVNYCYAISELAGMAVDEDDNGAKAYVKFSAETEKDFTEEEHTHMHEVVGKRIISSQLEIDESLLSPISYEEYLENNDDD